MYKLYIFHQNLDYRKKLQVACSKGNEDLEPWLSDITNHFFHSADTCNGDVEVMQVGIFLFRVSMKYTFYFLITSDLHGHNIVKFRYI